MGAIKRKCDNCGKEYNADTRNLRRGWGRISTNGEIANLEYMIKTRIWKA